MLYDILTAVVILVPTVLVYRWTCRVDSPQKIERAGSRKEERSFAISVANQVKTTPAELEQEHAF